MCNNSKIEAYCAIDHFLPLTKFMATAISWTGWHNFIVKHILQLSITREPQKMSSNFELGTPTSAIYHQCPTIEHNKHHTQKCKVETKNIFLDIINLMVLVVKALILHLIQPHTSQYISTSAIIS